MSFSISTIHTFFGFTDPTVFWTAVGSLTGLLLLLGGLVTRAWSFIGKKRELETRKQERSKALIREFEDMKGLRDGVLEAAHNGVYPGITQRERWKPVISLLDKIGREIQDKNADETILFDALGSEYVRQAKALEPTIEAIRKRHTGIGRLHMEAVNSCDLEEFSIRQQRLREEQYTVFPYVLPLMKRWERWVRPKPRR